MDFTQLWPDDGLEATHRGFHQRTFAVAILQLPEVVQTMTTLGMVADYMTPAELRDHVQKEAARWSAVARAANIKGE